MRTLRPLPAILRRPSVTATVVVAVYATLGLAALWPILPAQSNRMAQCACGDPVLAVWFLEWVPSALFHGHNPLFTYALNAPAGVNLAQNTSMPLLGVIMAPLTLTVGPIASYNLLLYLAFPLSAMSMFFVLMKWTGSTIASFAGGLIYGFSTFSTGQGIDHPMFSFLPLPPLILLLVYELIFRQTGSPYRNGFLLGLLAIGQFFIEPEVLADMAVVVGCGTLLLLIARRRTIRASPMTYAIRGFTAAAALGVAGIFYPAWFMLFGRQHFSGLVQPSSNPYHSDLLGPIIPTSLERLNPTVIAALGQRISQHGAVQNDSYVGLPLLLVALVLLRRFRRDRWLLLSAATATIAFVFSLGKQLRLDGHQTSLRLPFDLIAHLPLLGNILPVRFSFLEETFISITIALGCANLLGRRSSGALGQARRPGTKDAPPTGGYLATRDGRHGITFVTIVLAFALFPLVPSWPYPSARPNVPTFFSSSDVEAIPSGSSVLTYPLPIYPYDQAMLWQAVARIRFCLIGGYALQRGTTGTAAVNAAPLAPSDVEIFLRQAELGSGDYPLSERPVTSQLVENVRLFLQSYQVRTVVVDPMSKNPTAAIALFTKALGPPRFEGGVAVWKHLTPKD